MFFYKGSTEKISLNFVTNNKSNDVLTYTFLYFFINYLFVTFFFWINFFYFKVHHKAMSYNNIQDIFFDLIANHSHVSGYLIIFFVLKYFNFHMDNKRKELYKECQKQIHNYLNFLKLVQYKKIFINNGIKCNLIQNNMDAINHNLSGLLEIYFNGLGRFLASFVLSIFIVLILIFHNDFLLSSGLLFLSISILYLITIIASKDREQKYKNFLLNKIEISRRFQLKDFFIPINTKTYKIFKYYFLEIVYFLFLGILIPNFIQSSQKHQEYFGYLFICLFFLWRDIGDFKLIFEYNEKNKENNILVEDFLILKPMKKSSIKHILLEGTKIFPNDNVNSFSTSLELKENSLVVIKNYNGLLEDLILNQNHCRCLPVFNYKLLSKKQAISCLLQNTFIFNTDNNLSLTIKEFFDLNCSHVGNQEIHRVFQKLGLMGCDDNLDSYINKHYNELTPNEKKFILIAKIMLQKKQNVFIGVNVFEEFTKNEMEYVLYLLKEKFDILIFLEDNPKTKHFYIENQA